MTSETAGPAPEISSDVTPQLPHVRRNQGAFNAAERNFLSTHLPAYRALSENLSTKGTGVRRLKSLPGGEPIKGEKKKWVLTVVHPLFSQEFKSSGPDGPTNESLQDKLVKWFANHGKGSAVDNSREGSSAPVPKAPRAVNATAIFAHENAKEIADKMAEKRLADGTTPKESNLINYKEIRKALYEDLDDATKLDYEEKAAVYNARIKEAPSVDHIHENQANIADNTFRALRSLIGNGWGQHGDVAFYVIGAYRNKKQNLVTFGTTVSDNRNAGNFVSHLPDYDNGLRKPFKEWAGNILPQLESAQESTMKPSSTPSNEVTLDENGQPRLPEVDGESIPLKDARRLLHNYMSISWATSLPQGYISPIPLWEVLHSKSRFEFLKDPAPFSLFSSLDPSKMTASEVYGSLQSILSNQSAGIRIFEIEIKTELLKTLSDRCSDPNADIDELPDPEVSTRHQIAADPISSKAPARKPRQKKANVDDLPNQDFSHPFIQSPDPDALCDGSADLNPSIVTSNNVDTTTSIPRKPSAKKQKAAGKKGSVKKGIVANPRGTKRKADPVPAKEAQAAKKRKHGWMTVDDYGNYFNEEGLACDKNSNLLTAQ